MFMISSGAVLGGLTGVKISILIDSMNKEYLFISMVKILNYIEYLEINHKVNEEIINKIKNDFVDFKYNFEKELINNTTDFDKDKIEILNYAFIKLVSKTNVNF